MMFPTMVDHVHPVPTVCIQCAFITTQRERDIQEQSSAGQHQPKPILMRKTGGFIKKSIKRRENELLQGPEPWFPSHTINSSTTADTGKKNQRPDEDVNPDLAEDPEVFPKDECSLCLCKLFPEAHGDEEEVREARSRPFDYQVYQGSSCVHMFHHQCLARLFAKSTNTQRNTNCRWVEVIEKCPLCRTPISSANVKRMMFLRMGSGEVTLVYEDIKQRQPEDHRSRATPEGVLRLL